ncbi:heme NO-binding domain-containing protein [Thermospira aquatica]|uniref:Heme NO-binding domain-containing protein n=1 Tax=Thermospira aquatica TaxID=2828656 RepID=A0AAX3BBB4_9SPIR|nr:heme NO-binding domain-containing protein [Thermospira aquatica]URA09324.1 heme NO-binding domain-containing protein [Thermospira aquatica]
MKILFLKALKSWILSRFGEKSWINVANAAGIGIKEFNNQDYHITNDRLQRFLSIIHEILDISEIEFKNSFVTYWLTDFSPLLYQTLMQKCTSSRELLITIIKTNNTLCEVLPNPFISRIDIRETSSSSLSLVYPNEKALVDIIAVLRSAAKTYNDSFSIKKINQNSSEIKF